MREFALIERLRERVALARTDVILGIGDDAAVLAVPAGSELVVSMDTLVAGVHFPYATTAFDVGWKALAVNLSDLAAMGAEPAWCTLALTLPEGDTNWVDGFIDGFAELASRHGIALVGGDTTRGPLSITLTVHGFVAAGSALRRDRASAGELVVLSGNVGEAAAGLSILQKDQFPHCGENPIAQHLVERLNRPTPRVALGRALRGVASACIDVSDGLVADLGHIAARSGVGVIIETGRLQGSATLRACSDDGAQRLAWQLSGGDDYELCFCVARERLHQIDTIARTLDLPLRVIGRVESGSGVRVVDVHGHDVAVARAGWDHFA